MKVDSQLGQLAVQPIDAKTKATYVASKATLARIGAFRNHGAESPANRPAAAATLPPTIMM
jgi:hypothetical protein